MKKYITLVKNNPLISGSIVVFFSSNIANVFNLLFNLFMSRNLSVEDFGILLSLVSLITLATIPAMAIMPTVINFAAAYFAKDELDKVRGLLLSMAKFGGILGVVLFAIFFLFAEQIGTFFHIENHTLIIISGLTILFGYLGQINIALLQAKLAFTYISVVNFVSTLVKLVLGVGLVFLGFRVYGAIWAFFSAYFIPFLMSFIPLRPVLQKHVKTSKTDLREIVNYGVPSAIALIGITSFISTDILLVKHFFSPQDAGVYAGLSMVGRIIFFLTGSITTVMFPLIVQKYTKGENYHQVFYLSFLLVFLPALVITLVYFLVPELIITLIIKQDEFLINAPYLGWFGVFITVYSLISLMTNFFLATKRTNVYRAIIFFAFLQAILIWFYHSSVMEIVMISLGTSSLLLIYYLLYYFHASRR